MIERSESQRSCTIIIPTLVRADLLQDCVIAVRSTAPTAEVIVVNEGRSFGEHCNLGAEQAKGEVLVFLNDDTVPQAGWLDALIRPFEDPAVAIVGCRLIYPDGRVQHAGVYFDRVGRRLVASNRRQERSSGEAEAVTGACLAIRAGTFRDLGGFDQAFRNGLEDADLCLRARATGWKVWYVSEATVVHHESASGPTRWTNTDENVTRLDERWRKTYRVSIRTRVNGVAARTILNAKRAARKLVDRFTSPRVGTR